MRMKFYAALLAAVLLPFGAAQADVTVGGQVEVIGGSSDHAGGLDGLDRGLFSRIAVGYSTTLDNGLEINAQVTDIVHQAAFYAPDVLYLSVGSGFGTFTAGHHAMAACSLMPRIVAMVPGGVNATWYTAFSGLIGEEWDDGSPALANSTFTEGMYCWTPTGVSYATPEMGGLKAMVSFAPNVDANQLLGLQGADALNILAGDPAGNYNENYVNLAASFSSNMGGMDINLGVSAQRAGARGSGDWLKSTSVAGTVGLGGATVGASWYDNGDRTDGSPWSGTSGWNVGAKYALGSITPGITYSSKELEPLRTRGDDGMMMTSAFSVDETALVVGANYDVGGGLSVFGEYMMIESEGMLASEEGGDDLSRVTVDESILMGGMIVSF